MRFLRLFSERLGSASVGLLPCVGSLWTASCSSDVLECAQAGCTSGAGFSRTLDIHEDRLPLLHARVCRNNLCNEGPCVSDHWHLPGALEVEAYVLNSNATSTRIDLRVVANDLSALRDDDAYRFTLFDAKDGTVYADDSVAGPYCPIYPNGFECGVGCQRVFVGDTDPWGGNARCWD